MFDDFETQIQIEEIIPEEYEDWLESLRRQEVNDWENNSIIDIQVQK